MYPGLGRSGQVSSRRLQTQHPLLFFFFGSTETDTRTNSFHGVFFLFLFPLSRSLLYSVRRRWRKRSSAEKPQKNRPLASYTRWPKSTKIKQRNKKERGRRMKAGQPTPLSKRRNESSGEDPAGISLATVDRDVHRRTTSEKRLGLERCHLSPLVFLGAFWAHTYTKECCPSGRLQSIDYKDCKQCRLLYSMERKCRAWLIYLRNCGAANN